MERSTMLLIGKPSISMGHLYHGYVSHNQRVDALASWSTKPLGSTSSEIRGTGYDWINQWGISKKSYSLWQNVHRNMYSWVKAIIFHSPELLGHFGMIPLINHDSSEGEQWGRSEVVIIYPDVSIANHIFPYHSYRECFAHCFTNLNVQGKTWISQLDGISCNINHRSNMVQLSYSIIYSIFGY